MRRLRKLVATLLLSVMSFNIFADGTVVSPGQQATVTIAPNGVSIVNINAPNAGISVTNFQEFNVGANGEVINNADNTGRSYVAGLIPGNPNYGPNQAAQLIILQVNGSNRSSIEGYLEVLSRSKPNVILSNENGITVNGGGTIGIANFTATTGKVNLVDGQYIGINTTDGSLIIGPKGFDGSTADYVNFIAKNIQQSGKVVSGAGLTYIAGANNVSSNGSVAALPSNDASVAIDVSNLGGMYAGVVKVISTSKGAGVNIDGYAVATGGTLEITADGQINVNKVQGKDINIKGTGYTQNDIAYTEGNMNVDATNIILNGTGTQASNINLNGSVTNNADIYTTGTLTTGNLINNSGIQALGNITVNGNLNNTDTLQTNGSTTTTGNTLNSGEIYAQSDYSTKNMNNSGILQSGNNVTVTDSLNNSGELQTTNKLNVTGTELKNTGSILADSIGATITTTSNDGKIVGISNINVTSQTLNNTKDILSNGDVTLKAQSTNSGVISTNGNVDMSGNKVTNNGEIAATNINLNSTNLNNSGSISANGNVELNNSVVDNTKDIIAYDTANMNNSTVNNKGKVISNTQVNLDKSNVTNTGEITSDEINMTNVTGYNNTGTIKGNTTRLTTTNDLNLTGTLHGEDRLEIKGNNVANNGGTTGTGYVSITSNDYTNNTELSAEAISINASGNVVNNNMITAKDAEIKANSITNNDLIATEGYLGLTAQGQVINTQGSAIYAGDNLVIKGSEVLNQKADILGQGTIDINASHVKNEVGTIKTLGDIYITSSNFENVGEVTNFDYTTYWVDWQGNEYTDDFIQNNWAYEETGKDKAKGGKKYTLIDEITNAKAQANINSIFMTDNYRDDVFNFVKSNTNGKLITGTTQYPEVALEQKIKSSATTNYATLSAGGNIIIDSDDVLNKNGMITARNIVQITADRVENVVSLGDKVQLQDGQEEIHLWSSGKGPLKRYRTQYIRTFVNGTQAYVSGQPSVIEGNTVIIESPNIVTQAIPAAQGKIITGITTGGTTDSIKKEFTIGTSSTISQNGQVEIASNVSSIQVIKDTGTITVDGMSALSAMFTENSNPDSKYLLETRSQYVKLSNYYGSDYFLNNIGYEEEWNRVRRLGDAYYEYQLITKTIQEKLGTSFIDGLSDIELIKYLMDNAKLEAKDKGLVVGQPLTSDQIANLDRDIIWYVYQNVNGVQVLAPQIYLTQEVLANIDVDGRNKIGGKEQTIIKTDNLVNNGTKIGDGGVTYVEAKSIKNQTMTNQLSEISGDSTYLLATDGNIENLGGKIRGTGLVSVVAENGQIINTSTKNTITRYNGEYDRTTHEEIASVGEISSQGTTYIEGQGYTSIGAITGGGEQTVIDVGDGNVNISSIALTGSDKFGSNSNNYSAYGSTQNIGSELQTENIQIKAANLNIKGSTVAAQTGYVDANVNIESSIDSVDTESKSKESGFLSKSSSETKSHQEENVAGTLYVEGQGYVTGNINSIGSNVILGENSYVGGKVTTDAQELNNSYYHTESKSGFQANFSTTNSSATGQVGYGKSSSTQTETSKIYSGSNLSIGNGSVLNNGASITATNFQYGQIQINNGDVTYGARVNEYDSSGSSSSSFIGVTATISSGFLGSASQIIGGASTLTTPANSSSISGISGAINGKSSDGSLVEAIGNKINDRMEDKIEVTPSAVATSVSNTGSTENGLGAGLSTNTRTEDQPTGNIANQVNGSVEVANGVVGMINGLASNITTIDGKQATMSDIANGNFKVNNDFYVSGSVNVGFTSSTSSYSSHQEEAVVTKLVPLDENSSITYNNVNNITYQGTVAQGGTFIYNGVDNITKEAVELRNSSTNESINFGMNVGVGVGANGQLQQGTNGQTGVTLNMSAGLSNMKTEGTTYQNGTFVDVNEVHNGTGTMTLNGFNQVGGAVTGNIKDVKIISKQNTSTTDGESVNGSVGIPIMGGGAVTGSVGFSTTTGDRAYVDTPSSLIVGAGSNLTIGNGTNIGGIVGTTDGGSMIIKNYYGEDIENHDTYNTTGASIGMSGATSSGGKPKITGFGVQYENRELEGTTHNTVIGNVSIGNATGDEINRDETKVQETTKNTDTGAIDTYVEGGVLDLLTVQGRKDFLSNIEVAVYDARVTITAAVKMIESAITQGNDISESELRGLKQLQEKLIKMDFDPKLASIKNADLNDPSVWSDLGVNGIVSFDPSSDKLPEAVKKRIEELNKDGKSIGIFYDSVTNTIYVNKNSGMTEKEIRASVAREVTIKSSLENGEGKTNEDGQLKATTYGEMAYNKVMNDGDTANDTGLSVDSLSDGTSLMKPNSEVTADNADDKFYEKSDLAMEKYERKVELENKLKSLCGKNSKICYKDNNRNPPGYVFYSSIQYTKFYKDNKLGEYFSDGKLVRSIISMYDGGSNTIRDKLPEASKEEQRELLSDYGSSVGSKVGSPYEALYVLSPDSQKDVLDAKGNLELDKFDPAGWKVVENTEQYKEAVEETKKVGLDKALEELYDNPDIEKSEKRKVVKIGFKMIGSEKIMKEGTTQKFALGSSVVVGTTLITRKINENGSVNLIISVRYNLSDSFSSVFGNKIEYGTPYDMKGPEKTVQLLNLSFKSQKEYSDYVNRKGK